ncbi:hypothetical protein [Sphingobacterium gobiense]|uniref:DNA-binding protein n=1 Tax=Sphingobacterium gobiense TaxID=1382456 RepID=A0A2S9JRZ9_9SPHI|nr:hypothetical protein [Sphingobacterium gobiense]PRD56049.1 hypothetical protein C5749_01800 [Sphingobacterium gobiense]
MQSGLNHVIELLTAIKNLLSELVKLFRELVDIKRQQRVPLQDRHIWTKEQVLEKMNMTEPTYNRNLKKKLLNPMRLGGSDMYFEEDILKAIDESRRKGKI